MDIFLHMLIVYISENRQVKCLKKIECLMLHFNIHSLFILYMYVTLNIGENELGPVLPDAIHSFITQRKNIFVLTETKNLEQRRPAEKC